MLHISIIIVDYNSHEETFECLESLQNQQVKGFKYNIVIIDNGSKEHLELPKKLQDKNTEVMRSSANLGFTGGNNMGIYHAIEKYSSDYVLLLNNDTIVKKDFLKSIFECAEDNPKMGLISPKIYFAPGYEYHSDSYQEDQKGNVLWYAGGSIDWQHLAAFHRGVDEIDRGQYDPQKTSDFATGCAVIIRREVLEKIGTFDKRYFLYLEDVDLSMEAQKAGYEIGFCPKAVVWHKNASSSGGSGSKVHEYYQTRNRLLFAAKHGEPRVLLTALRLALRDLFSDNQMKRLGVISAFRNKFGKQPVV